MILHRKRNNNIDNSFLTLSNKFEKCAWFWFFCCSLSTVILLYILWVLQNWYILFKCAKACFVLNMVYVGLMLHVHQDTKEYQNIRSVGKNFFKMYFNIYILHLGDNLSMQVYTKTIMFLKSDSEVHTHRLIHNRTFLNKGSL